MSFPNKNWWGIEKGWQDLGKTEKVYREEASGGTIYNYQGHIYCGTITHIGREENGQLFKFCPKCLIKLVDK